MKSVSKFIGVTLAAIIVMAVVITGSIFPNKYSDLISRAAQEFNVDGSLVRAVIWQESRFNPSAVSNKGAMGLMQIMPATFDECALAVGALYPFDPNDSIRCGTYYLSKLIARFNGDYNKAIMAYNAGAAYIERTPLNEVYSQTQHYLAQVKKAHKFYKAVT